MWLHQDNFSSGELSPRLNGLFTTDLYSKGCRALKNAIINRFGNGVKKRGGTRYIGSTSGNNVAILVPFTVPGTGEYVFEIGGTDGSNKIQIYKVSGDTLTLLAATLTPVWADAQLFDIQWAQDIENQKIYLVHPSYAPRVITRTSDTSWAIATHSTNNTGPALIPRGKSFTMSLDDITAGTNRNLTAQDNIFTSASATLKDIFQVTGGWVMVTAYTSPTAAKVTVLDQAPQQISAKKRDALTKAGLRGINLTKFNIFGLSLVNRVYTSSLALEETKDWSGPWVDQTSATPTADTITIAPAGANTVGMEITISTVGTPFTNDSWIGKIISLDVGATASYTKFALITARGSTSQVTAVVIEGTINNADAYDHYSDYSNADSDTIAPVSMSINGTTGAGLTLTASGNYFSSSHVGGQFFLNGGAVTVTAYTNETTVTVTANKNLERSGLTWSWEEGWSADSGYPAAVATHQGRLIYGGVALTPSRWYGSQTLDFDDFTLGGLATDALHFIVPNGAIKWIASAGPLVIGTDKGEHVVGPVDGPITPSMMSEDSFSFYGGATRQPLLAGSSLFFVTKDKSGLRETSIRRTEDGFSTADLFDLADHLVNGTTIKQVCYLRTPDPGIVAVLTDGTLCFLTYRPENGVRGWSEWTGLNVVSAQVIPGSTNDLLCLVVQRTVSGTKRYVEVYDPTLSFDSAGTGAISTTTITGLTHLNGLSLGVIADSVDKGDATPSAGTLTIPNQSSTPSAVEAGVRVAFQLDPNPRHTSDDSGYTFMRDMTLSNARIYLNSSVGGEVNYSGAAESNHVMDGRIVSTQLDEAPPLFTGWRHIGGVGGSSEHSLGGEDGFDDPVITITHNRGYKFEVLAVATELSHVGN